MNGKYLLDTNIIISLFAKDSQIHDRMAKAEEVFVQITQDWHFHPPGNRQASFFIFIKESACRFCQSTTLPEEEKTGYAKFS